MWHLHAGHPERCIEGSERREDLVFKTREVKGVLCESMISSEECRRKLAESAAARAAARA